MKGIYIYNYKGVINLPSTKVVKFTFSIVKYRLPIFYIFTNVLSRQLSNFWIFINLIRENRNYWFSFAFFFCIMMEVEHTFISERAISFFFSVYYLSKSFDYSYWFVEALYIKDYLPFVIWVIFSPVAFLLTLVVFIFFLQTFENKCPFIVDTLVE